MKKIIIFCLICLLVTGCTRQVIEDVEIISGENDIDYSNNGSDLEDNLKEDEKSGDVIEYSGENDKVIEGENNIAHSNNDNESEDDLNEEQESSEAIKYLFENSSSIKIDNTELSSLTIEELDIAKNEIFARHGHDFSSKTLREYFKEKKWYNAIEGKRVTVSELNKIEQENVTLIDLEINKRKNILKEKNVIILKEINSSEIECDWDLQLNKYPLKEKVLCYKGEFNQGNEKNNLVIYFCGYSYNDYLDANFEIIINNVTKEIIADYIGIVDFDEEDDYIEIIVNDYWENGVVSSIFRYVNGKLICIGSNIGDDMKECLNYSGKFVPYYNIYHFLEEPLIPRYYVIENHEFIRKYTTYDEVKGKTYTVTQEVLDEIMCYDKLKVGDKIKILNFNDETSYITGESQGIVLRVMNEEGEIFEIGYVGSWT